MRDPRTLGQTAKTAKSGVYQTLTWIIVRLSTAIEIRKAAFCTYIGTQLI